MSKFLYVSMFLIVVGSAMVCADQVSQLAVMMNVTNVTQ